MKNQLSAQFIINESLQAIADEPALQANSLITAYNRTEKTLTLG